MPLGDMIRYSEPARYDAHALRVQHRRLRRSLQTRPSAQQPPPRPEPPDHDPGGGNDGNDGNHLTLNFTAHHRSVRALGLDLLPAGCPGPARADLVQEMRGKWEKPASRAALGRAGGRVEWDGSGAPMAWVEAEHG